MVGSGIGACGCLLIYIMCRAPCVNFCVLCFANERGTHRVFFPREIRFSEVIELYRENCASPDSCVFLLCKLDRLPF